MIARLATLLGLHRTDLAQEITPCGVHVPSPCWTREPFPPVPVATDASTARCWHCTSTASSTPASRSRSRSSGTIRAARLQRICSATRGGHRGGREARPRPQRRRHDRARRARAAVRPVLRGSDGQQYVQLNPQGYSVGGVRAFRRSRATRSSRASTGHPEARRARARAADRGLASKGRTGHRGAVVAMDPQTGRILASASYPSTTRRCSSAASPLPTTRGSRTRRPARRSRPGDRRAVRAGLDVQADHVLVTRQPPRDQPDRATAARARSPSTAGSRRTTTPRRSVPDDLREALGSRATRSSTRPRPPSTTPTSRGSTQPEAARVAAADGGGLRRRPAPASTCRAASRRPARTPTGRPGWRGGRPTRRSTARPASAAIPHEGPGRARVPHPARQRELHRRLALPGRRQRRHVDRAGRDDGVAAATRARLLGAGQRRRIWEPTLGLGRRRPVRAGRAGSTRKCATGAGEQSVLDFIANSLRLQPRPGGLRRARLHRLAVPGPDRRQDRHGRGLRQAGHVLAGDLGADVQECTATPGAVRRRRHGRAGRDRRDRRGPMLKRVWDGILGRRAGPPGPASALPPRRSKAARLMTLLRATRGVRADAAPAARPQGARLRHRSCS